MAFPSSYYYRQWEGHIIDTKTWTEFQMVFLDYGTSLVAQTVKRLPTMRETQVQSLGWEILLEKEMVTHSSILAWKIPWTEKPGRLQSMGSQRVGHDWAIHFHFLDYICVRLFFFFFTL